MTINICEAGCGATSTSSMIKPLHISMRVNGSEEPAQLSIELCEACIERSQKLIRGMFTPSDMQIVVNKLQGSEA